MRITGPGGSQWAKRVFDIVASAIGLVVLSPLLLLIAVLVRADSRGPTFYRGVRTGLHGQPFRIFKYRTMVPDAERRGGTSTAKGDPRVTRLGRMLRRYKLDELPQLFNVLLGDMSIVGPRPEVEEYTSTYTDEERLALSVRPGITDYASMRFVNLAEALGSENADQAYRDKVRAEKSRLRIKYVREQTFWRDIGIICSTLITLLRGRPWSI